jgi:transcriptional regulator with XRE-family HTH domain
MGVNLMHGQGNGHAVMSDGFAARVHALRKQLRLTLEELGARVGVSNQAVQKWESGKSFPSAERLQPLADALQTSVAYLLTGATQFRTVEPGTAVERSLGGRLVPQLTPEQAVSKRAASSGVSRYQTRYDCSEMAFQMPIWTTANAPDFRIDDTIVIDPDLKPVPGDMVLAAVGTPREPFFAQYRQRTEGGIELRPLNSAWSPRIIETPADGEIIGTMTEHARPRRSA